MWLCVNEWNKKERGERKTGGLGWERERELRAKILYRRKDEMKLIIKKLKIYYLNRIV